MKIRFAATFVVLLVSASVCLAETAGVRYSDGRPSEEIQLLEKGGNTYISMSQVSRLLGLEVAVDWGEQELVLRDDAHTLRILIGGTVWMLDGQTMAAGDAALREGDEVFLSLAAVEETLAPAFRRNLTWDRQRSTVIVGLPAPNIIDVEVRAAKERVSATIETIGKLNYDFYPAEDGKVRLHIRGGVFSKRLGFEAEGGLIERVEAVQGTDGADMTVTLGGDNPAYRVYPREHPDGIVVMVWKRTLTDIPEPEFRPPKQMGWADRFSPEHMELDLVVIDPGHGGENFGSIGPSGYMEKEFNLEVSRKLKAALEHEGIEVLLTRNDDSFVDLETRTEVANSVGADLLVSMHANGYRNSEANGFEVYFLSPAMDDEARTVAAMENGGRNVVPISAGDDDELAFILWDTAQNEFVVESSHLAQMVNEEMHKRLTLKNRGVKQAGFVVLAGVYLPAVLVETAFITNPREEALLKDEAFQETVADAIVEAILRFKADYGR
jgi:N-acetylmuramoyl-L-alanine amidase